MIHLFRKPDWFVNFLLGVVALGEGALLVQLLDQAPKTVEDAMWLVAFTMLGIPYLVSAFFLYRWLCLVLMVLMVVATLLLGELIVLGPTSLGWPFQPQVLTFKVLQPWQVLFALVWLPVTTGVLMTKSRKQMAKLLEIDDLISKRRELVRQRKEEAEQQEAAKLLLGQEEYAMAEAEELPEALPAPQLPAALPPQQAESSGT